ncbi:hypothetical protein ACLB2K_032181 [Fragaria x ananassa]
MHLACITDIVIISGADFHSSRESMVRGADSSVRTSGLSLPARQLARVSTHLGKADSLPRGVLIVRRANSSVHVKVLHLERTHLACKYCTRGGFLSSRISIVCGADSTAHAVADSTTCMVVLTSGANSTARAVVVACRAHLSARVTISILLRQTTQLARVSALLCEEDSSARPVMSAYKSCTRTHTKLTRELCS